jgi:hypothetical protein
MGWGVGGVRVGREVPKVKGLGPRKSFRRGAWRVSENCRGPGSRKAIRDARFRCISADRGEDLSGRLHYPGDVRRQCVSTTNGVLLTNGARWKAEAARKYGRRF